MEQKLDFLSLSPPFPHKCNGLYSVMVVCVSFGDTQMLVGL